MQMDHKFCEWEPIKLKSCTNFQTLVLPISRPGLVFLLERDEQKAEARLFLYCTTPISIKVSHFLQYFTIRYR